MTSGTPGNGTYSTIQLGEASDMQMTCGGACQHGRRGEGRIRNDLAGPLDRYPCCAVASTGSFSKHGIRWEVKVILRYHRQRKRLDRWRLQRTKASMSSSA